MKGLVCSLVVVLVLAGGADSAIAQLRPDATVPPKTSEGIVADLARGDVDAFAAGAAKYMGGESATAKLKGTFDSIKTLGKSQYSELVYSRDYGLAEKDLIYKIDFEKNFAFVRLLWHLDNGRWVLSHIGYATENSLPFPKGWEHIYPKQ